MRHRLRGRSFSRKSAHRKAMFENLAAALLKHEQIRTTLPKAKALRPFVERLITIGKHGGLAGRRRAIAALPRAGLAAKLVAHPAQRHAARAVSGAAVSRWASRCPMPSPNSVRLSMKWSNCSSVATVA